MEACRVGARQVAPRLGRDREVERLHLLEAGRAHDQALELARCEDLDDYRAPARAGAPSLHPERREPHREVDRCRIQRIAMDEALGDDERMTAGTQHTAELARRG